MRRALPCGHRDARGTGGVLVVGGVYGVGVSVRSNDSLTAQAPRVVVSRQTRPSSPRATGPVSAG